MQSGETRNRRTSLKHHPHFHSRFQLPPEGNLSSSPPFFFNSFLSFFIFFKLHCSHSVHCISSADFSEVEPSFLSLSPIQKHGKANQHSFEEKGGGAPARRVQLRCGMERKLPLQPPACNPCRRRCRSSEEEQRTKRVLIQELDRTRACPLCGFASGKTATSRELGSGRGQLLVFSIQIH